MNFLNLIEIFNYYYELIIMNLEILNKLVKLTYNAEKHL